MSCSGGPSQRGRGARRDSGSSSPVLSRSGSMRNTDDFLEFNNSLVRDDQQAVTTPNSSRSNQETPRMRQSQETQSLTPATVTLSVPELERIVRRAVAQAQAPLLEKINAVNKKVNHTSNQMTKVENFVENMNKKNKDILEAVDKKKVPISMLLTGPGCVQIKSLCMQNLHLEAHSQEENTVLDEFLSEAKENGWLLENSAKSDNDIKLRFRDERHTLKQQIRDHIKTDYSGNAVADRACQLSKTKAYMMRHMGDIIPEVELILYQLAYILAKYLNSKKVVNDADDRRVQKSARNNLYGYLYKRIKRDTSSVDDLKNKIKASLVGGFKYSENMTPGGDLLD